MPLSQISGKMVFMIIWFIIFILLLIILFFISRVLVKNLYLFFYLITKNEHWSIQLLTWILLPGTVVHEVSHMLIAELTGIKTDRFSFTPEVLENNQIKAGSITMEKPGPFRQSLIGIAPVLFGIGLISLISYFLSIQPFSHLAIKQIAIIVALFYLLFVISNSMFSSSKDLEQIMLPIILLIILGGAFGWLALKLLSLTS